MTISGRAGQGNSFMGELYTRRSRSALRPREAATHHVPHFLSRVSFSCPWYNALRSDVRLMRNLPACCIALAALVPAPVVLFASPAPPACVSTPQTFSATGAVQTYSVPSGTTALLITADGASGGRGSGLISGISAASHGAHLQAGIPVSSPLLSLDVVVGGAGGDGPLSTSGAGGGGGSFVFTAAGVAFVAAGGGGGGFLAVAGADAQLGPGGGNGGGTFGGAGGTAGSGGAGGTDAMNPVSAGGGGGFLTAGGNGAGTTLFGSGGHRVSPPGDAAGGSGSVNGTNGGSGGFGGGGGGAVGAGAGGGGYSGGGGGGFGAGGGGGSFVATGGTIYASSVLTTTGNGSVTICATAIAEAIPALSSCGLISMALLLLTAGMVLSRRRTA